MKRDTRVRSTHMCTCSNTYTCVHTHTHKHRDTHTQRERQLELQDTQTFFYVRLSSAGSIKSVIDAHFAAEFKGS